MIQVIVLLITAIAIAMACELRVERVVAVLMMGAALLTYGMGLVIPLNYAVIATVVVMGVVAAAVGVYAWAVNVRRGASGIAPDSCGDSLRGIIAERIKYVLNAQCIIVLIACGVGFCAFSGHKVIHWDDLNVWGIYPKTLFVLNKLPFGIENCSVTYKDYLPIQQIMQYFFIYRMKTFDEQRLFQINICFMYILMAPILERLSIGNAATAHVWNTSGDARSIENAGEKNRGNISYVVRNLAVVVLYFIFPHVFTTQFYYKLGVDYLISILFGIGVLLVVRLNGDKAECGQLDRVVSEKKSERYFDLISLCVIMTYLATIKSSGIVLVIILIALYLLLRFGKDCAISLNVHWLIELLIAIIPFAFYISWKVFAKATGNVGYMSETVQSSFSLRHLYHSIPSYTVEVLIHYIKNVLIYPLTREVIGITAIIIMAVIAVIQYVCRKNISKKIIWFTWIGLGLFCIGHVYMYLFVFDEWEAHDLLEFDRYICQYLAGMLMYYLYVLVNAVKKVDTQDGGVDESGRQLLGNKSSFVLYGVVALFIVLFPYKAAVRYLIPDNYNEFYSGWDKSLKDNAIEELKYSRLMERNIPIDEDNRIMLVTDAWDDSIMHFTYEAVPHVITCYANVAAFGEGGLKYIESIIEDRNIKYVYVTGNARDSYAGDFDEESKALTDEGQPLQHGMYVVGEDGLLEFID